jgi:peptidoglycan DL-endopeptidase CwlO
VAVVVAYALEQVGKPYVFAADGPDGYDCSGLVKAAYAQVGMSIPHQTGGIIGLGRPVGRNELTPGDLVFPSSGHVGIALGGGMMVHAPHPGDHVRIAPIYAFWAARRLL